MEKCFICGKDWANTKNTVMDWHHGGCVEVYIKKLRADIEAAGKERDELKAALGNKDVTDIDGDLCRRISALEQERDAALVQAKRYREALELIHGYPYNYISHVYEIAGEALAPTLDRPVDANKGTGTPASQQPVEPGESGR